MSIMADKDTVVSAINKFIAYRRLEDVITLFDYLCEAKQIPNKDDAVKAVTANPIILHLIAEETLKSLETHYNITRVTDKNNQLISVF